MPEQVDKRVEYRICWSASSNASFRGATDWLEANEGESVEEVEDGLDKGAAISPGLEMALGASGFEWYVETREVADV